MSQEIPTVTMSDDEQNNSNFEQAGSSASATYPVQCSTLRKGGHVIIKGRPCKIVDITTSQQGQVHLVGIDIFTG
ncbi:Eukaryotic translation initiation factor 5A [Ceratobasidium sp. 428]|nr:Eukaryotic translation initiation factor 5A [Ceratobasidium sp. 428]